MNNSASSHSSVLPVQFIELMNINPDGVYIDATFGRGGHSQLVLNNLSASGRLIAFDRDPEAVLHAKKLAELDSRLEIVHSKFSAIPTAIPFLQRGIDGAFFDLGVSSPQLDDVDRGFSFKSDGPLDMRMDQTSGMTAEDWVNSASEKEIARVLWTFGEERNSRKIAKKIVWYRGNKPIKTTKELANIVRSSGTRSHRIDSATRSFQAIRIFINEEISELEQILNSVVEMLSEGGRLLIISFHSLEDRVVKRRFRELSQAIQKDSFSSDDQLPQYKLLTRKPVMATNEEINLNRRARSARLRGLERL